MNIKLGGYFVQSAEMKFISFLFLCSLIVSYSLSLNLRPIIGIVSETTTEGHSYIAASYVKYIESAGARVVPIINNITQDELKDLFGSINGVLFPGGGSSLVESAYLEVAKTIFELAKQANDEGDYFPLWGTCLGFQLLCVLQSGTNHILSSFDSEDYSIPLNFTDGK
ncbi:PREDICTED: gamma-glutamyl hydrolase A-like [Amphimedon queenslandica]|uniref:folate gamma-glutamyl hydrolase n=2 Tax=Amphimedon queenslandica TaxID=400682 RepID=A0AAN0ITV0_AMPQE|nr:PREDICTED: gamma-glutamyl hydrolase A-like [Amphimedon queenslandica]|eukprot:XP_011409161.2 PREDICTED: gamma-glutamyl hydrolase A-like [Amphimedon queenslandica]